MAVEVRRLLHSSMAQSFDQIYASWRGQPGWVHRIIAAAVFLVLLGLAAFLLLWGLIVAAIMVGVTAAIVGVRSLVRHFTGENAMRKNVRVVRR